jgi:hypothetical protein
MAELATIQMANISRSDGAGDMNKEAPYNKDRFRHLKAQKIAATLWGSSRTW